jgi:hypothetical protein
MPLRTRWFRTLGFRGLGFRTLGFRTLGSRTSRFPASGFCVLGFCIVALLAGCAARPPAQPPLVRNAQTPSADPSLSGTILAVHPVPAASLQQVETLLSGADPQSDAVAGDLSEFIVRTGDGTTISVVQPETADLHPGEQVRIVGGESPHISVPVIH